MEEFNTAVEALLSNPMFLAAIPAATVFLVQFLKKRNIPGELALAALSLIMGTGHYFLMPPEASGAMGVVENLLFAAGFIWTMATGYYKTLIKIFPSLSSKKQ